MDIYLISLAIFIVLLISGIIFYFKRKQVQPQDKEKIKKYAKPSLPDDKNYFNVGNTVYSRKRQRDKAEIKKRGITMKKYRKNTKAFPKGLGRKKAK